MARLVPLPFDKKAAPYCIRELPDLVERIEKAMRPLAESGHGSDHERVRALYTYLVTVCTGNALERARRVVLYEMLSPVLQACHGQNAYQTTKVSSFPTGSKRNTYGSKMESSQSEVGGTLMVTVTDAAGAHLARLLEQVKVPDNTAVRLLLDESHIVPQMDHARPGDTAFSYEGKTILLLDELTVQSMQDKTLDVQNSDDGPKIVLRS
jgi:hypothetical protein